MIGGEDVDYVIVGGELYHAGGWEKKDHKYVKRERGKNGKWVYYYPTNSTPKNKANKGYTEYKTKDGSETLYVNENSKRLFDKQDTSTVSTYKTGEHTITTVEIGTMTRTLNKGKSFVNKLSEKVKDTFGYNIPDEMTDAKIRVLNAQQSLDKAKKEYSDLVNDHNRTVKVYLKDHKRATDAGYRQDTYLRYLANDTADKKRKQGTTALENTNDTEMRRRQRVQESHDKSLKAVDAKKAEIERYENNLEGAKKTYKKLESEYKKSPAYKIEKARDWVNDLFEKELEPRPTSVKNVKTNQTR